MVDYTKERLETPYGERAKMAENAAAKTLFEIMEEKKSNLALAADFYDIDQLFEVIDAIGPHIAVLKTHMDLMNYYSAHETMEENQLKIRDIKTSLTDLVEASVEHEFLIFEDRKFIDIGGVAKRQYTEGTFRIVTWADLTNAYALPGPGTIKALLEGADEFTDSSPESRRGLILLPYMTPEGNLFSEDVAQGTMDIGKQYPEFVMGWIGAGAPAGKLEHEVRETPPSTLILTPGCKLPKSKLDEGATKNLALGQVYTDPENLISRGSDVMIVGSGIYGQKTPQSRVDAAKTYQEAGWEAYEERLR